MVSRIYTDVVISIQSMIVSGSLLNPQDATANRLSETRYEAWGNFKISCFRESKLARD
jgi:hypothetical protein